VSREPSTRARLLAELEREIRLMGARSVLLSQAIASRLGLSPTDLETLDLLHAHGPLTAGSLAELTGLTTGAITGMVDRLERAGLVRRERDPDDGRAFRVVLTERGQRFKAVADDVLRELDALVESRLDEPNALVRGLRGLMDL
jgi:DNA-binding MarR family transcriptional regulator